MDEEDDSRVYHRGLQPSDVNDSGYLSLTDDDICGIAGEFGSYEEEVND